MNRYLEKIASFKLPKAITRYSVGGSKAGVKQNLKDFGRQSVGSSTTRLGGASKAAGKASRWAEFDYNTSKKATATSKASFNNSKALDSLRTISPDKAREARAQAFKSLDDLHAEYAKAAHSAAARASRASRANNLGTKGARTTIAAGVGGAGAIGVGGYVTIKKLKKD